MSGKKFLTKEVWGKKNLAQNKPPIPTPQQSQMGDHIGGGEEADEFDTLVDVIRQQNGWLAFIMWWLLRVKFCISRLKIRRQKTKVERESSKGCSDSFLWTKESFLL